MKYFLDTEFLEGIQKRGLFNIKKPKPTIDLISIGIVCEDGREYYAISKGFNLKEAWNRHDLKINKHYPMGPKYVKDFWIRQNVLYPIFKELYNKSREDKDFLRDRFFTYGQGFKYSTLKVLIDWYGIPNSQIASEIIKFTNDDVPVKTIGTTTVQLSEESQLDLKRGYTTPEFYGYYADYDWVVFCWLFGKMMDLPKGFPMYCRDLKQMLDLKWALDDEMVEYLKAIQETNQQWPTSENIEDIFKVEDIKKHPDYPKQDNEHNALEDAKWNLRLYNFLNGL